MQEDGACGLAVMRPAEYGEANRDQNNIDSLLRVAQTEYPFLRPGDIFAPRSDKEKHIAKDIPISVFVGMRQSGHGRGFRNPQTGEFPIKHK